MSEIIYSWSFKGKKNRWSSWYIVAISIVIWLVVWWFLTEQYWMSFIVLLISWIAFFIENNSDDDVKVEITKLWIKLGEWFYDFSKIDSYSFIYSWENPIFIRLYLNKKWLRNVDLLLDENIVLDLKDILPEFLEENPKWELSLMEKIISILKL